MKTIDLSGKWMFSFGEPSLDDTIMLPGTTAMAGKGKLNMKEETGFLTERYPYEGKAYFARKITIPPEYRDKHIVFYMERTRLTRVWLGETYLGEGDSLTTPQEFDLMGRLGEEILLTIEVANCGYPTAGGHMTSPDTQTNWLGIMGRIALFIYEDVSVRHVRTIGCMEDAILRIECEAESFCSGETDCVIRVCPEITYLSGLIGEEGKNYTSHPKDLEKKTERMEEQTALCRVKHGKNRIVFSYRFKESIPLWSEYAPYVMRLCGSIAPQGEEANVDCFYCYAGMRNFTAQGHDFFINGEPVKLRGTHDALLFPQTGAAPMDIDSWICVMGTARQYGINHYRFHTCCPPEATFLAADMLGIYMEPELPFWGTIAAPGEDGYCGEEQEYLIREGLRMMEAYGNHPSFCMLSLGNELWGNRERIREILTQLKSADSRFLFTAGSNNFQFVPEILPEEDFFVGVRLAPADEKGNNDRLLRGSFATCDAPLGKVQTDMPSTAYNYDAAIECGQIFSENMTGTKKQRIQIQYKTGVKEVEAGAEKAFVPQVPVVCHEVGQYAMFPDFREIETYTGVLKASNMEIFRRRLEKAGMGDRAEEFFENSGKFAAECYREEIEAMHRSRYVAGYQLLDIKDYTGQGTSYVGILNAQMQPKGLVEPETWRTFLSDEVLLASFSSYIYTQGEDFQAEVILSCFNPLLDLKGKDVSWQIAETGETKQRLCGGRLPIENGGMGTYTVGTINGKIPVGSGQRLTLSLWIEGTRIRKEYQWWIYPAADDSAPQMTYETDADRAWPSLCKGERVVFFPENLREYIPGFYCTDFWNYTMFRQISESMGKPVAAGTLGLSIQNHHPMLSKFSSETYSTPQWYHIVSNSRCVVLDGRISAKYRPIVQMIDNVERNHKLGILFEAATAEGGRLLVCTASEKALRQYPEGRQFLRSIFDYADSEEFTPKDILTELEFMEIFS